MRRFLACLLLVWACQAAAAEWKTLPGSRLEFTASYERQPIPGVFRRFDVALSFDPGHPAGGRLDVAIATGAADLGSSDINETVKGADWFDAGHFPTARFTSTDIAQQGPGRYVARGTLSLKGVQRNVAVPFTWTPSGNGAAMDGRLNLKRTDFNIGSGVWARDDTVGMDVGITFGLKLQKAP